MSLYWSRKNQNTSGNPLFQEKNQYLISYTILVSTLPDKEHVTVIVESPHDWETTAAIFLQNVLLSHVHKLGNVGFNSVRGDFESIPNSTTATEPPDSKDHVQIHLLQSKAKIINKVLRGIRKNSRGRQVLVRLQAAIRWWEGPSLRDRKVVFLEGHRVPLQIPWSDLVA